MQAGRACGSDHALACLLALNALRVSEAYGADIRDLGHPGGHQTLRIVGKGEHPTLLPLAPRTYRAIAAAIDERLDGPILHD